MGLAFINKLICGKDTSTSCHLSLSPENITLPACCFRQVGWHGPTDPSKPLGTHSRVSILLCHEIPGGLGWYAWKRQRSSCGGGIHTVQLPVLV